MVNYITTYDDFEGGETVLTQFKVMAKPKPRRLIMFPPMWAWCYKGNLILNGKPKYIVETLLHYV